MAKFYWDEIQKLAKAHHLEEPLDTLESFQRFLEFWWSRKYNRPLKDPLLQTYTLEELAYEWLRNIYTHPDHDPRKELEKKVQEDDEMEWIKAQLQKHIQEQSTKAAETDVKAEEPTEESEITEIPELPDISTKFE